MTNYDPTLKRVLLAIGGVMKLADALGVSASTIASWTRGRLPAKHMPRVEALTGIPSCELRPDLYVPFAAKQQKPRARGKAGFSPAIAGAASPAKIKRSPALPPQPAPKTAPARHRPQKAA